MKTQLTSSSPHIINRGHNYGVIHYISPGEGELRQFVKKDLGLSLATQKELFELGAIYLNGQRIVDHPPETIKKDDYLRIHSKPRRFPNHLFRPEQQTHFENQDFLIFNKPSGLPVHATVDNRKENLITLMAERAGKKLFITHRLDIPTRGLILFAKTESYQRLFNSFLQNGQVNKIYRALVDGGNTPLPSIPHRVTHFMEPSPRAPKNVTQTPTPGWQLCEMEILSLDEKTRGQYDVRIRLITGRTHQIRTQLADLGLPIVGDHLYSKFETGSATAIDQIELECCELSFPENFRFNI